MGSFAAGGWATNDIPTASDFNTLSGAWDSYTPTVGGAGWALGNGTISGRWKKVGRVVTFSLQVTWGTTSTFGGTALTLTAPTAAVSGNFYTFTGQASDTGTATYLLGCTLPGGSSTITPYTLGAAGTYLTTGSVGLTTSVPHTWASTDLITVNGVYEASS
jgi:hypothetical protein